jgi:hypothetical protein
LNDKNNGGLYLELIDYPSYSSNEPNKRKELIGKDISSSINKKLINDEDYQNFKSYFSNDKSYNYNASICWLPQIAIYEVDNGEITNYIEISLDCNRIKSLKKNKYLKSAKIDGVYQHIGLSFEFRKFIRHLLEKYFSDNFERIPKFDDSPSE